MRYIKVFVIHFVWQPPQTTTIDPPLAALTYVIHQIREKGVC